MRGLALRFPSLLSVWLRTDAARDKFSMPSMDFRRSASMAVNARDCEQTSSKWPRDMLLCVESPDTESVFDM